MLPWMNLQMRSERSLDTNVPTVEVPLQCNYPELAKRLTGMKGHVRTYACGLWWGEGEISGSPRLSSKTQQVSWQV